MRSKVEAIRLNLSSAEHELLTQARGRVRRATYCQDAVLWFSARVEDYLRAGHSQAEVRTLLERLLSHLRPVRDRWHRSGPGQGGASFVLSFTSEEMNEISQARGAREQSTSSLAENDVIVANNVDEGFAAGSFAYIAVRCRIAFDTQLAATPPVLVDLVRMVENSLPAELGRAVVYIHSDCPLLK